MEKPKYEKPTAVSLDEVASVLGDTCTFVGDNFNVLPTCVPNGGTATGLCSNGNTAGQGPEGGRCTAGGTAGDRCSVGANPNTGG